MIIMVYRIVLFKIGKAEKRELPEYLLRLMKYRAEVEDMMKNKL